LDGTVLSPVMETIILVPALAITARLWRPHLWNLEQPEVFTALLTEDSIR